MRTFFMVAALVLLLAVGMLPAAAAGSNAPFSLETHYNLVEGTSLVVMRNEHTDAALAQVPWEGRLPLGVDAKTGATILPTRLLAQLRDILDDSSAPEAWDAAQWLRSFMGQYADSPASEIGRQWLSAILGQEESWWCGERVHPDNSCPGNCTPKDNPGTCSGCGCKGHKIFP
ncbi:hypothetical protein D6833_02670 [Candidatus Parcubacteria bacterium]|nr:MAG: hypothetical protein D6833_02670 [Candidatus Parcubacteria bacterium]